MRGFLAIPLPDPLRREAADLPRALLLPRESWRFVREDGLHVTVRFLGEVDPSSHARFNAAWREAAGGIGPLSLRVGAAVVAPSARRPRVVWLPVRDASPDGSLGRLAGRIERAARACGFPPEDRPFAGHVTLARARRGARIPAAGVPDIGELGNFVADRLVLYLSRLGPGGSIYEELSSYPLDREESP